MGQDEVLKVVGGVVIVVLVIALIIFLVGQAQNQSTQLTDNNVQEANEAAGNAIHNMVGGDPVF